MLALLPRTFPVNKGDSFSPFLPSLPACLAPVTATRSGQPLLQDSGTMPLCRLDHSYRFTCLCLPPWSVSSGKEANLDRAALLTAGLGSGIFWSWWVKNEGMNEWILMTVHCWNSLRHCWLLRKELSQLSRISKYDKDALRSLLARHQLCTQASSH